MPDSTRRVPAMALMASPASERVFASRGHVGYKGSGDYSPGASGAWRACNCRNRALADAHHQRRADREVDDGCRLDTAISAVEHGIDLMLEPRTNFLTIRERQSIPGQHQRRTHERLTELRQEEQRHRMVRDADADRAAALVLQPPRRLGRRRKQERIRAWSTGLDEPELPGIKFCKTPDVGKIAAYQCEMMMTVCLADSPHALECVFVADMTAERIAGIGGIGDNAARAHDIRRTADKPRLRGCGVQFKVLTHGGCPISYDTRPLPAPAGSHMDINAGTARVRTARRLLRRLQGGRVVCRNGGSYGVDGVALDRRLRAQPSRAADAPLERRARVCLRHGDAGAAQPAFHSVEAHGIFLAREPRVEPSVWRRLNWLWIVFYIFLGFLNLAVAFNASERAWVNFKVIGLTLANFVFVGAQILWRSEERRVGKECRSRW